ncbi:MAG TPA: GNAT family N-acetyltransferase [Burkholderiales bacterium]|nr:GNAT family N-acetyltransferase [Burkholderiales bacterium]
MTAVRAYRAADLAALLSVFRRSVHDVAGHDYSPTQLEAWAPEHPDSEAWSTRLEGGGVFVCERDDEIVGFARVDDAGYVDLLYVHPEFLRQGIGRALLQRMIAWVQSRSVRRLVSDVSITARPFFERAGFRLVEAQEVERQGVRLQNFRMERDMDAG